MILGLVLVLGLSAAWLASVTWFAGGMHYPGFRKVQREFWPAYHADHMRVIGLVVLGPLFAQLVATGALIFLQPGWWSFGSGLLLVLSAGWTFFVSGPEHGRLGTECDEGALDRLVRRNWVRALAWSVQAVLCGFWVFALFGAR